MQDLPEFEKYTKFSVDSLTASKVRETLTETMNPSKPSKSDLLHSKSSIEKEKSHHVERNP